MSTELPPLSEQASNLAKLLTQKVQKNDISVPLLPEVANKVITLTQDPESDSTQLAKLIQSDPSLAAHVMKIANSAAYSPNASMVSLQQAITRLGMNLISDIAIAASISTKMFKAPGFETHISFIWKHALMTALWSKEIARACRLNVEATFLCGLLHSIGRPVALQTALEMATGKDTALSTEDLLAIEESVHTEVGACVLKKWDMPLIICESLQYFYSYNDAPHAKEQTAIVNAAAKFATHTLKPEEFSRTQLTEAEVLGDLNLYQDEVMDLLDKRDNVVGSMEAMSNK